MSNNPPLHRRILLVLVAALAVLGFSAGPALAGTSSGDITSFSMQPTSTQSGGTGDVNIAVGFGSDTPKSMQLNFAPGLFGSLTNAPAGTQVASGTASLTAAGVLGQTAQATVQTTAIPPGAPSGTLTGVAMTALDKAFNLGTTVQGYVTLNPDTAQMQMVFPSIPNSVSGLPIAITGLNLSLPASTTHGQFIRLPSANHAVTSTATETGYNGTAGSGSDSFTPTGNPPFSPSVASASAKAINNVPNADVNIDVKQPNLGQAGIGGMKMVVPGAVLPVNIGAVPDLTPQGTEVGTVSASSPLLPYTIPGTFTVSGSLNAPVATIAFPTLGGLHFSASIPPRSIATNAELDFNSIPDLPITDLSVSLPGGSRGMLNTICGGSGSVSGTFSSQYGQTQNSSAPVQVSGCPAGGSSSSGAQGGGSSSKVGKPTLSKLTLTGIAKGKPRLAFRLTRGSKAYGISAFSVNIPGGLSYNTKNFKKDLVFHGAKVKSAKVTHGKLVVELKQRVNSVGAVLGIGSLKTSKALETSVKKHKIKSLNFKASVRAYKTTTNLAAKITRFS